MNICSDSICKHYNVVLSILFGIIFSFFFAYTTIATELSPLRQTIVLDPGQQSTLFITVSNTEDEPITFHPTIDAFTTDEQTGTAIFGQPDTAIQWITFEESFITLAPGATQNIPFTIQIPKQAQARVHYLGLFVEKKPSIGQIGISSRVGSLLFLYVGGEIEESLVRENFSFDRPFYTSESAKINLTFSNVGGIHVIPTGNISIQNKKGRTVGEVDINPLSQKVLSGALWTKTYDIPIDTNWRDTGELTAKLSLKYGITDKNIFDITTVWYIPKVLFLLLIFVFFVAFLSIISLSKFLIIKNINS